MYITEMFLCVFKGGCQVLGGVIFGKVIKVESISVLDVFIAEGQESHSISERVFV